MAEYNSMYFSKEDIYNDLHYDLLELLINQSNNNDEFYNDIHIVPGEDGESLTVSWVQTPWSKKFGGRFEYIEGKL